MARGNNYSVQQALQQLQTDQRDDSCDEEEKNKLQDEDFIPTYVAAGELSDSDTDSDEDIPASSSTATVDTPSESNNNASATRHSWSVESTKWNSLEKYNRCCSSRKSLCS